MSKPNYLSVKEVADKLELTVQAVYHLVRTQVFTKYTKRGKTLILESEVDEYDRIKLADD